MYLRGLLLRGGRGEGGEGKGRGKEDERKRRGSDGWGSERMGGASPKNILA